MGIDEILVKPFSTNDVQGIVERYLEKKPAYEQDWIKCLAKGRDLLLRKDYAGAVTYLDSKRAFLSESGKKEADIWVGCAKKLGGIK